jgi:hypothetical protein
MKTQFKMIIIWLALQQYKLLLQLSQYKADAPYKPAVGTDHSLRLVHTWYKKPASTRLEPTSMNLTDSVTSRANCPCRCSSETTNDYWSQNLHIKCTIAFNFCRSHIYEALRDFLNTAALCAYVNIYWNDKHAELRNVNCCNKRIDSGHSDSINP